MSLRALPKKFSSTRDALHQIAFYALGPARYQAMGRMGLRALPGGFGTPPYDGKVARVEGDLLVYEQDGNMASRSITTVRDAAEFFGVEYQVDWYADFHDPPPPADPDTSLEVDREAALALADWFDYAWRVLGSLLEQGSVEDQPSEIQLWPEHFDAATELGDADAGQRASFGASPGDKAHPEPYLYVAAWSEIDRSHPFWNDKSFNGASLDYSVLSLAGDPLEQGLDFLLVGYRILHTG